MLTDLKVRNAKPREKEYRLADSGGLYLYYRNPRCSSYFIFGGGGIMTAPNPQNEKIKRRYRRHLKEARGLEVRTVDAALRVIVEYESFVAHKAFGRFCVDDAIAFKKHLLKDRDDDALSSRSTIHGKLKEVRKFFRWLSDQDGYRSRIRIGDADFFNLPARDVRIASERRFLPFPSLEDVQRVIRSMPADTWIEKRNRAIMALNLMTAARVGAMASLKMKHVRADRSGIDQDAREVRTKRAKTFTTFFVPVGDDILEIFLSYVDQMKAELAWGQDDPLFPSTKRLRKADDPVGFERKHWKTTESIRAIIKTAFATAGLAEYCPHSFRRTLSKVAQERCSSEFDFKCFSQNIGHEDVRTTRTHYCRVDPDEVRRVVRGMTGPKEAARSVPLVSLQDDAAIDALVLRIAEMLKADGKPKFDG